jgi:cytochrome P450
MHSTINADFLNDPYRAYRNLRERRAPHWSPEFCGGAWLLSHYDDVATVLRDPRFSVRRAGGWANSSGPEASAELREFKRIFARSLLFVDAPQHTRLRKAMNAWFAPAALQKLGPVIDGLVDSLLEPIVAKVEGGLSFDFMEEFALPLPALVIAHMLGVDSAQRTEFVAWSDDIAAFIGALTRPSRWPGAPKSARWR